MRGVHFEYVLHGGIGKGSSPHARGPRFHFFPILYARRIIPACAGSTFFSFFFPFQIQDHPRMRGVHSECSERNRKSLGSSPHARGPQAPCLGTLRYRRIIPACAGSTPFVHLLNEWTRDHPRMRGVHRTTSILKLEELGSSPHARGPPRVAGPGSPEGGIIPACAGSTLEC